MIGLITWQTPEKRQRSVQAGVESVLHMGFFCVRIVPGRPLALRRRTQAAAKLLRRAGVNRVVLPADFHGEELLEKYGITPVPTMPLRQSLAAELVYATAGGGSQVAVAGERPSTALVRAVTALALRSRYLLLSLSYGGEELCRSLRREYGVSILLNPEREALEQADTLVLFAPRADVAGENRLVLRLYDGAPPAPLPTLVLPPEIEKQLPAGCDRPQLLAALWEGGVLRPGQITVEPTRPAGMPPLTIPTADPIILLYDNIE